MGKSSAPTSIGDYTLLHITIPATSNTEPTTQTLYLRQHAPKIPTANDSRSLFVVNVPIDSTAAHFRSLFTSLVGAGRFEDVVFEGERNENKVEEGLRGITVISKKRKRGEDKAKDTRGELPKIWNESLRRSGSSAVCRFVDEKAVEAVLKASKKGKSPTWPAEELGSARYEAHRELRFPDHALLQASVDEFMVRWNEEEEEKTQAAKRLRNVPDADGFVTVGRGGRVGPARAEEAEERRRKELEKEEKRKAEMGDFYRFQMRERRKEEQGELVRRFEEDKRRLGAMKEKRGRFRPE